MNSGIQSPATQTSTTPKTLKTPAKSTVVSQPSNPIVKNNGTSQAPTLPKETPKTSATPTPLLDPKAKTPPKVATPTAASNLAIKPKTSATDTSSKDISSNTPSVSTPNTETKALQATIGKSQDGKKLTLQTKLDALANKPGSERNVAITLEGQDPSKVKVEQKTTTRTRVVEKENKVLWIIPWGTKKEEVKEQERQLVITQAMPDGKSFKRVTLSQDESGKVANQQLSRTEMVEKDNKTGQEVIKSQSVNLIEAKGTTQISQVKRQTKEALQAQLIENQAEAIAQEKIKKGATKEDIQKQAQAIMTQARQSVTDDVVLQVQREQSSLLESGQNLGTVQTRLNDNRTQSAIQESMKNKADGDEKKALVSGFVNENMTQYASQSMRRVVTTDDDIGEHKKREFRLNENMPVSAKDGTIALNTVGYQEDGTQSFTQKSLSLDGFSATKFKERVGSQKLQEAATSAEKKLQAYQAALQKDPQNAALSLTEEEKEVLFQYATTGQQSVGQSRKEVAVASQMTLEEHQAYLQKGKVDQADYKANLENYITDNNIPILGDAQQFALGSRRIGTFGLVEGAAQFATGKDVPFKAGLSENAPLIGADKQLEDAQKLRNEAISDNRGAVSWLGENLGGGLRRLTNAVQGKGFTDEFNVEEQRKKLDPALRAMVDANAAYDTLAKRIPNAKTPEEKQALERELNQALTTLNTARAKLTTVTDDVKKFQEESLQNGKMVLTEAVGIGGKLITAGLTVVGGPVGFAAGLALSGALNVGTNWLLSKDTPRGYNPVSLEGVGDFFAGSLSGIPLPGTGVAASGSRVALAKTGQSLLTGQGSRFVLNRLSTNVAGRGLRDLAARAVTRETAEAAGRFVFYDVALGTTQNMANKVASKDRADSTTFFDNNGRFKADTIALIVMDPGEWTSSFVSAVGMKGAGKALSAGKNTIVSKGMQKLAGEDFNASPAFAKAFNRGLGKEVREDLLKRATVPQNGTFDALRTRMGLQNGEALSFTQAWRHMNETERLSFFQHYATQNQNFKVSDVIPRARPVAQTTNNPITRFKNWANEKQEAQLALKQQQHTNTRNAAPLLEGDIFVPGGVGVQAGKEQAFRQHLDQYVQGLPQKTEAEMRTHAQKILPKRIRDTYGNNLSPQQEYALAEMYKGLGVTEKGAFTHSAQAQLLAGRQGKLKPEEAFSMVHHAYQLDGTMPLVPIGVRGVGGQFLGPEMKTFWQKMTTDGVPFAGVGLFEAGNPLSKVFPIIPVGSFSAIFRHTAGVYSMGRNALEGGTSQGIQAGKMGMLRGAGGKARLKLEKAFQDTGRDFNAVKESLEFFAATHAMGNGRQREKLVSYADAFIETLKTNPNANLGDFLRQKMGTEEFAGLARRTHSGGHLGSLDTPQKHQLALARYHDELDTDLLLKQRELQGLSLSGKSEADIYQEALPIVQSMDALMQEKEMMSKWHMLSMRHNMPLAFERDVTTGRLTSVAPDFNRAMQEGGGTYVYKMLNFMMGNRDMTPGVMTQLSKTTLQDLVQPTEFSGRSSVLKNIPLIDMNKVPKDVQGVAKLLGKPLDQISLMEYYTVEALRRNRNVTGGLVNQEKYLQNIRYILNEQLTAAAKDTNLEDATLRQLRDQIDTTLNTLKPQANRRIQGEGFGLWGRTKSTVTNVFRNGSDLEIPLQYRNDSYQRAGRGLGRFVPFGRGEDWRNSNTP